MISYNSVKIIHRQKPLSFLDNSDIMVELVLDVQVIHSRLSTAHDKASCAVF